jgi:hypothetical protein
MEPEKIAIDGVQYSLVQKFGDARAIISFDGLFVLVDRNPNDTWDLSGEPANEAEAQVLRALMSGTWDVTTVTVTKND